MRAKAQEAAVPRRASDVPASGAEVLRSPGQPLEMETRAEMQSAFGHDFSHVRVHAGPQASASAEAVHAAAYTVGQHIVFGHGHLDPQSATGRAILAHELAHTIQQKSADGVP